jgi:nucleotide-binding universal stress UspA family protein
MTSDGGAGPSAGRIVVGVDGSPSSAAALRWAAGQARLTGAEIHAIMTWELPTNYSWAPVLENVDFADDCQKRLATAVREALGDDGAHAVRYEALAGHPAWRLIEAADGADLLVVGSRGHGGFVGMLLGSVSQHVVAHAPCPVVVVHEEK